MDFATLKQRLGRRRGFDGNDARLGDFINDAYMAICGRRNTWSWLRRTHQFGTHTPEAVTASADGTPSATLDVSEGSTRSCIARGATGAAWKLVVAAVAHLRPSRC